MANWQSKKETQKMVHDFNQKHATRPDNMKDAKALHTDIMGKMDTGMKEKGWSGRYEYRGSSYEGTKVSGSNEFDVMRVQKRDDVTAKTTDKSGYYKLEAKPGTTSDGKLFEKKSLSTEKVHNKFKGDVQRVLNADTGLQSQVKVVDHGPAVQLDVNTSKGTFSHSTDFVPAYEVGGKLYVAKPPKPGGENSDPTYWKESHSQKEKADLGDKQTLRTLKGINKVDPSLQTNTYEMKNAVLHQSHQPGWDKKTPGEKVTGSLAYMKECADKGVMPGYGNKNENLFAGKSDAQLENMSDRMGKLSTNESDFTKVMTK